MNQKLAILTSKLMKFDDRLGHIRETLGAVSKQHFSKKYRLEIAAVAAAQEAPIWARQLARGLEIGENQAASELAEFEAMGALQRFPLEFDRRKLYQVVPHPLWPFAREVLEDTIRAMNPEEGEADIRLYWAGVLDGAEPQPILEKGS